MKSSLSRAALFLLSLAVVLADDSFPLHDAARSGNAESVQLYLDQGADPNRKDKGPDRFTALHVATQHGQIEVARLLLDNRAKVNAPSAKKWTALHLAAKYGRVEIARLLLDSRAKVNARTAKDSTALHIAAQYGQVEIARLLLDNSAKVQAWGEWYGLRTPLFVAVEQNQVDVARLLLERGAKPDRGVIFGANLGFGSYEIFPFYLAINRNRNVEMARLLIKYGGGPNSLKYCSNCEEEFAKLEQLSSPPPTANPITDRWPYVKPGSKAARENVNLIGMRDITGIINNYSTDEEIAIGRDLATQIDQEASIIDDPDIQEYVNRIGQKLATNSDLKMPLKIKVVQDQSINAFALPGGFFYVNSGLIQFCRDEAELAGVMAHEIAHIAGRHGTRQISQMELIEVTANALIEGLGGNNWGTVVAVNAARIALPLTFLSFSRTFERKADLLGVQYLYKTGYDPLAMINFFERLVARAKEGQGAIARAFSSHPPSQRRAVLLQEAIDNLLPDRPVYAITNSEFEAIKAAITERYGSKAEDPEETTTPELVRH